jgi:hypothetical protein
MNKLLYLAILLLAVAAVAQQPAAPATPAPQQDAMEPGVDTSSADATPRPPAPAAKPGAPPASNAAKPAATANKPVRKGAQDYLDLDSSQVTGNRELPRVLHIVPWRSAELGDLVGRPVNSLLDEVLQPVDRDVFRRQNRYFEALQPNEAAPAGKPEK